MSGPRRATKRQVLAVAARFGITIADDGDKIAVDLPRGYVLRSTGLHFTDLRYHSPPGAWPKPLAWGAVLADIADGIEPCTEPDCEVCTDDEAWAQAPEEDDDGGDM
ncbi:MAG: hypothetical protein JXB13_06590 [Phycisphaerae bacterium]|nr:hypothetical protein [Phycisphaerae bacterium]